MNYDHCHGRRYTIEPGDTLYSISRKFRIPLVMLMKANPYADVYNLTIGEKLCIPERTEGFFPCDKEEPDMRPEMPPAAPPVEGPGMMPPMRPEMPPAAPPSGCRCQKHPCMECMLRDGFAELDGIEPME